MIRKVTLSDAPRLAEIYRPYVESTPVTLEYDPPSDSEFENRIAGIMNELPYLIYEEDGRVVAYAYAHKYHARFGYRFSVELSVYVDQDCRGRGVGSCLYSALIELLHLQGYKNLYAIVVDPNPDSFKLHKRFGFSESGRTHLSAYKLGRWYDVVTFEKLIGDHYRLADPRKAPRSFDSLPEAKVREILSAHSPDFED